MKTFVYVYSSHKNVEPSSFSPFPSIPIPLTSNIGVAHQMVWFVEQPKLVS
jgi:hypothetical protein